MHTFVPCCNSLRRPFRQPFFPVYEVIIRTTRKAKKNEIERIAVSFPKTCSLRSHTYAAQSIPSKSGDSHGFDCSSISPRDYAHGLLALMTAVVHSVSLSSSLVTMDERKRPAAYDNDDAGPPPKRQATATVNGGVKNHQDADMPGKDELEVSSYSSVVILPSRPAEPVWS